MARFVVDLGDVKISKDKEAAIAHAIQKAALSELADLPLPGPFVSHFPREWLGFILRKEIGALEAAEKQIGQAVAGIR